MRILHVDAFSGAAGDMLLGALIDLGFDKDDLIPLLDALGLPPDSLRVKSERRGALSCRRVELSFPKNNELHHRSLKHLLAITDNLPYPETARARMRTVLTRLGEAEAKVHDIPIEEVHFHEVGAEDSLVDIVGVCLALERLGVERVSASILPLGRGFVECEHGILPLPAPATLELLTGVPTRPARREGEHLTPTAAALLTEFAESFGDMPAGRIEKVGYGAGSRNEDQGPPNALRLVLLEDLASEGETSAMLMVEADIDDMNPQLYPGLMKQLLAAGARDVALHPCTMKHGRPGTLVRVLVGAEGFDAIEEVLFRESTTIGLRYWPLGRVVAERRVETVETAFGPIRIKVCHHKGRERNAQPEFRDCAEAAKKHGVPVKVVLQAAVAAYGAGTNP